MALSDSSRGSQTPSEPKINANFEFLDSLLESPGLPLKSGPVEDFPYVNIQDDSGNFKPMYF
jgi:hypothetical protein